MKRTSSSDDQRELLRRYTAALQARKDTLENLRQATTQMRSALASSPTPDIGPLLERRDRDCRQLDLLLQDGADFAEAAELASHCADEADGEISSLARTAAALHSDSEEIARDIMQCQAECEAILRERLEEAAGALRESVRRRRLDAAYGPACKHTTPRFLDRQQ